MQLRLVHEVELQEAHGQVVVQQEFVGVREECRARKCSSLRIVPAQRGLV